MPGSYGFFAWIIIGGLAGWIASKIKGTDPQQGIVLNVLVGVVGALIGGWLLALFGLDVAGGGWFFTLFTSTLGAVILLSILQWVKK